MRIQNITNGIRNTSAYSSFQVRSYLYDSQSGAYAIEVSKDGRIVNLFLFYPGMNGQIESIAIYGSNLQGHLSAIRSSMNIFGMKVDSAEMDGGVEDFIDVYLEDY